MIDLEDNAEEIIYLTFREVLALYADIFGCSEQEADDQLRNKSGLISALSRPQVYAYYQAADIALQAAALAHGIAEGQPFVEGNKRTSLLCLLVFLQINGYRLDAPQRERSMWILKLSEGESVEALATRIRAHLARV